MKSMYVLQPYQVGSKNSKSLAIIIPSEVKKECNINTSTPFVLYLNKQSKLVTLQNMIGTIFIKDPLISAVECLEASNQQKQSSADESVSN